MKQAKFWGMGGDEEKSKNTNIERKWPNLY